jgi:hypothetical protein
MSRSTLAFGCLCALLMGASGRAHADTAGHVLCEITENGEMATGVVSVQRDGKEIASAACGRELSVPAGDYVAALRLDGAFDGPEQRQNIQIKPGAPLKLKADFATAVLEVRIASSGRRAAGMAVIKRRGQQLGTLGSGVQAHVSAGSYRVLVRYRTQEKDLGDITLTAGQHLTLDASFE